MQKNQDHRYNVFNNIHKALRSMLFDVHGKVQQTDFASLEAATVIEELKYVLACYDEHADHEDRFILANASKHDATLAEELEKDHETDHWLSDELRRHIAEWTSAESDDKRTTAGKKLFYALNDFIAFNLYHMNKEETHLLEVLWENYSDMEILGMEQQIVESIQPEVLMHESRWMMRSISNPEIAGWLAGVKQNAPEEVYGMFVQMAAEELPAERFESLGL